MQCAHWQCENVERTRWSNFVGSRNTITKWKHSNYSRFALCPKPIDSAPNDKNKAQQSGAWWFDFNMPNNFVRIVFIVFGERMKKKLWLLRNDRNLNVSFPNPTRAIIVLWAHRFTFHWHIFFNIFNISFVSSFSKHILTMNWNPNTCIFLYVTYIKQLNLKNWW